MKVKNIFITALILLLISSGAWGQAVTKPSIPVNTKRADGSAHQVGDSLFWSATYGQWIAAAGLTSAEIETRLGGASAPTSTEFTYLDATSSVQTQIDNKAPKYATYTATATAKDVVYMTAAGTAARAKADAVGTVYAIGFATETKTAAACIIQTAGVITITGKTFTPGLPVYISATTAGDCTQTAPTTVGHQAQIVGIAVGGGPGGTADVLILIGPVVEVGTAVSLPLTGTIATSATPYPSSDGTATGTQVEFFTITALGSAAELKAPIGTPTNGQRLMIRITDVGGPWALTYIANTYRASTDLALPVTTTANKTLYINFVYNSAVSRWDYIGFLDNF